MTAITQQKLVDEAIDNFFYTASLLQESGEKISRLLNEGGKRKKRKGDTTVFLKIEKNGEVKYLEL